jgi:glycosyltransferase involved in cell wall biosynthesis
MNQQLPVLIPEVLLGIVLVGAFVVILVASIYDVWQTMQRKSIRKSQSKFRRDRKLTISIIVQAHNNFETVEGCLDSIRKNRYLHYDIVVVDNGSTDGTRAVVRLYMQKYPLLPLKLYAKRHYRGRIESIDKGYDRSLKGDLVIDIDASNTITRSFLKDCATRFWYDNKLQVLHFNVNNLNSDSVNLLYFCFRQLCRSMLNKLFASVSRYQVNPDSGGSMYRYPAYKNAAKSPGVFGNYASSLVVSDHLVTDDKTAVSRQLSKGGSGYYIFAVILILLQTYSMYLAAMLQSSLLLLIGWLAAALFLLLATWTSEALNNKDKITLSLCAPFIYFLIYLQLIIYVFYISISAITSLLKQIAREFVTGAMSSGK